MRAGPIGALLLGIALLLGMAGAASADDCSDYPGGVLDGFAGTIAPSQLQIDRICTIRNYPASNPLRTNFSFLTQPGQTDERWLIIFDNVVHVGQMACNAVAGHKIWFVNGSSSSIQEGCQNLLIAVEKIDKQNPAGQTTVAVGVPFTYTLTMPVLYDPGTGNVINTSGSINDLHGVTVTDDLGATGVDLTYLSHVAYWRDSGTPVPHTFSESGGVLTFDAFPIIPAGDQIVVEITVVLDDSPLNTAGKQFVNTAKWDFGRLIDGVFYEPLPGEWGITPPLTIAAPELVVTKTGPATLGLSLNLGEWGEFALDVHNTGFVDAWDVTLLDRLPDGPTGGMCDTTPEILGARVFAADGVTPVPGKGALVAGVDYSLSYAPAPSCELGLSILTPAGAIGPNERLIVRYRSRLDADSLDGAALTNVAGAIEWFNADGASPSRQTFTRTLTDGTVGTPDHEDAHTVAVALSGIFFEKSVANLTTGVSPTTTAAPGDMLRYTLRLQATDAALSDLAIHDDLGALNASAVFVPGTLAIVAGSLPPGADASNTNPSGGTNGAGILDVRNLSVAAGSAIQLQFDIALSPAVIDGTVVTNQADLLGSVKLADSDDPNVNGQADPDVAGDEDPTRVVIEAVPPTALVKANTQATATIGEEFRYRISVPSAPHSAPLYDVRILDDLGASAADLQFVGVTRISGPGSWTPVNTGSDTNLAIEDLASGIDIPAGEQVVVEITVKLLDTPTNVAGLSFTNTASYSYDLIDGDDASRRLGESGTTEPMTIVEPELTLEKSGPSQMRMGVPGSFRLDVHNIGSSPAYGVRVSDVLPNQADGGMCDAPPAQLTAQLFEADGTTPAAPALVEGTDFTSRFDAAPTCALEIELLSAASAIAPDRRLIVSYQALLDADSQQAATLTNVAGATHWASLDASTPGGGAREYERALTDGTVGVLDHEDAHSVNVNLAVLRFEKTVANVSRGEDPATLASPGELLRYRLVVENLSDVAVGEVQILDDLDRLNAVPAFAPGTLNLLSAPAGADTSNTSASGGSRGTGVLDVRNLDLAGIGDSASIEFEIALAPVLANGTLVLNQSQLLEDGVAIAQSDDPNLNGPADPNVSDDEDPTRVQIESAAAFRVEKISTDLSGDPNALLAGETLRYTITVENVGNSDASDAMLRDAVPLNTTYVAGSTTLNGATVPDGAGGAAPLAAGIAIYAPGDPTPGAMRADGVPGNDVATLRFDVVIDPGVLDGTVISNQAFVSAPLAGVSDQPSDDPSTPAPDDPTLDVVGNTALLFAPKRVAIGSDGGSPGVVDPLDVLHYTITVTNSGPIPATGALLRDAVPANTTWVADSLRLNGLPVGAPDGGISPLASGIGIASSDLTPPLPGAGGGTLSPGESAVIEFDLQVDAGTPSGTLISNQAVVSTAELPGLLTDGDGNPATGPEPTVVVVGAGQQLLIAKQVAVVGGGAALAGGRLEYEVRVTNVAVVAAQAVVITDDLSVPVAGQLSYVARSATLNGVPTGVSVAGSTLTADYSGSYGALPPGASAVLRFRADIAAQLAIGTVITNTGVVTWNTPPQTASASVSIDVGGVPGVGALNGAVWHDTDFDDAFDSRDIALADWSVELLRNGQPVGAVLTSAAGLWSMAGIAPNDRNGDRYALRFRGPGATATSAALGIADSPFTNGLQEISDIVVASGSNLQQLNLPIEPNGVVYDSLRRAPVAGATLTLRAADTGGELPADCFDDPVQQGQVTRSDGYYKFDLNFSGGACASGADYEIALSMPAGGGFDTGLSQIIPPQNDGTTPPFDVPGCPGTASDAVIATGAHCEMQASALPPPPAVLARSPGTAYHTLFVFDASAAPGTSQIFNNHLPVDPVIFGNVAISKTTPSRDVSRGDLVPYEIVVRNALASPIPDLSIADRYPAGFRYVDGSARVDGVPTEPTQDPAARELVFTDVGIDGAGTRSVVLLLAVGAGVGEGIFTNTAQAVSSVTGNALSGEAHASVRVVPDPDFACTDVIGKVFDDRNRNGSQENGESGIAGARLVTARGLIATTDPFGRFHITCAIVPNEDRGSNFILKLDDRSLPSGYRMSTRATQVKRATAGKALRFEFGASLHRVVALDLVDSVFEPDTATMREQWVPRLDRLLEELAKAPASLRLAYVADLESAALVDRRLESVKSEMERRWRERSEKPLLVETEIYWRRGAPAGGSLGARLAKIGGELVDAVQSPFRRAAAREAAPGDATERHLPPDAITTWTHDPETLATDHGDQLAQRQVPTEKPETVKLKGVVPPIRFPSGVAEIPASSVEKLRNVLDEMRHLDNVRLHLVGHADDQPLRASLAALYGDNEGLSRERAGTVAEHLKAALALPPEAISFAYAGDREPVASNASEAGRAQNRRVEVEVWYDEPREALATEDVVVESETKRVKVCRTETVCKLRYREGHARRARIRNLIAPLHVAEDSPQIPDEFVEQVRQALDSLQTRQNTMVKFVGYTDDAPLEGRTERIYGTHLALSKARAHRVARAIQDRLELPSAAVGNDGYGSAHPIASNATEQGRALNQRVEVEFWYDDPLQELPDAPQPCPDPAEAELVTKVFEPPWGRIEPIAIENGEPRIPAGYAAPLRRALEEAAREIPEARNVRLRFVGYTRNERLDRRTASVYGDDVGLSVARARRTLDAVLEQLGPPAAPAEHEGRGYVHSNDVVNAGFLQGDTDHVAVQVVYDEPNLGDDRDGIEITKLARELHPKHPLELNPMHISVDGEPIDDPERSSADIQRCTDVALEKADIRFEFDDLDVTPRLSVTASPGAVPSGSSAEFRMYTNYGHFVERSEVRVFERSQSTQAEPLAVIEVGEEGSARWEPGADLFDAPVRELSFVLRAYDAEGRFDETAPQRLWLSRDGGAARDAQ
ncbi:MAG TPA: OmpA family protein, partial [Myxococcota bacterium]|nr:OmpA family protein [Myxococcota bacterium]